MIYFGTESKHFWCQPGLYEVEETIAFLKDLQSECLNIGFVANYFRMKKVMTIQGTKKELIKVITKSFSIQN